MSLANSKRLRQKENVQPSLPTKAVGPVTRSSSNTRSRKPLADVAPSMPPTTPRRILAAATTAPPTTSKSGDPSIIAAFGIGSIASSIGSVLTAPSSAFGMDYEAVINKKLPKKDYNTSFKDHDAALKTILDDHKAALVDALTKRNRALEIAKQFDATLQEKLAHALQLQTKLEQAQEERTATLEELKGIKEQLEAAKRDIQTAKQHEMEANQEIDEASAIIRELESNICTNEERIRQLEEQKRDADALNQGLEDDKEELKEQVAELQAEIAELKDGHDTAMANVKGVLEMELSAAKTKVVELSQEVTDLGGKLAVATTRVTALEKAASLTDIEIAKLKTEREAAIEAKLTLQQELDRNRQQQETNQTSLLSAMERFNRTQELQLERERDLTKQMETQVERIQTLTTERDALRASETTLKVDLRDSMARETSLTSQLEAARHAETTLRAELEEARGKMTMLTAELTNTQRELEASQNAFATMKDDLETKLTVTSGRLSEAEGKLHAAAEKDKEWLERQTAWNACKEDLENTKAAQEEQIARMNEELHTLRESAGATEESQLEKLCQVSAEAETLRRRVREMQLLKARLAEAESTITKLKESVFEGEIARRALHNQVQELKGNIRVYIRVRPVLPGDQELALAAATEEEGAAMDDATSSQQLAVSCAPDGTTVEIIPPPPRGTKEGFTKRDQKPVQFTFDNVFGPRSTQEDVYNDVSHLVQSALDGYNVCLFSYGQTGSGKTHTMQGGSGENAGLIPRSVKQILEISQKMADQGWKYSLEVSFLEIYNENLRDLLRVKEADPKAASLSIHQDAEGSVEVPGLTKVTVSDGETIDALLARAAKRRAVACTNMNELSSRSHQVFTLYIRGEHAGKGIAVKGTLNLCDLAGSERLAKSGAEGDRKKETAAINKSLSCLADVFTSLAKKAGHIPFRNSKLTHLLQPCFRGDGKTLMMVNLSPTVSSAQETLCSLRFAAQVSQVELGKPKKRIVEAISEPVVVPPSVPAPTASILDESCVDSSFASHSLDESIADDFESSVEMKALPTTATISGVKRAAPTPAAPAPAAKRPAVGGDAGIRRGSVAIQSNKPQINRAMTATKYKTIR